MADVKHDHHVLSVIDLVQHSPVAARASTVDPRQLRAEWLAPCRGSSRRGPVMKSAAAVATSKDSRSARARRAGARSPARSGRS
jgi:hypothetical protein